MKKIEKYVLLKVISQEGFGTVYFAMNKNNNKKYAIKVIPFRLLQVNIKLQERLLLEVNILTNIQKNNHIISYFDMLKTQNNFYFVYEYCNGGTLQTMLRRQNTIQEKAALLIFKQVIEAFQVLHKQNIIIHDLKPSNIFFHNGVVKVGNLRFYQSGSIPDKTRTMLGIPIYMAPQLINWQTYSNKAIIWSIGLILYTMLYGHHPFNTSTFLEFMISLKQKQLQFPSQITVSNQTKKLLKRILTKDPQKRIQWMQLFQIKISADGKLQQQLTGKLLLADQDKSLVRAARQINDGTDESSPSSPISTNGEVKTFNSTQVSSNSYNYISPKSVTQPAFNDSLTFRYKINNEQK